MDRRVPLVTRLTVAKQRLQAAWLRRERAQADWRQAARGDVLFRGPFERERAEALREYDEAEAALAEAIIASADEA